MILNDLERRNSPYFAFFSRNLTDFEADYITVVEDRPIISVKYCLPPSQRGLSALAEHLVRLTLIFLERLLRCLYQWKRE